MLLTGPSAAAAKEFVLDGTVDCGVQSGLVCSTTGNRLAVITDDLGGPKQRATIDISWLKDVTGFHQDELVCVSVETRPDGGLQALGLIQPCPPEEPRHDEEEEEEREERGDDK